MTLSTTDFLTGYGLGEEKTTQANNQTSTSSALKGTTLSSFTNKDKFAELISNISNNISNGSASLQVFGQSYDLTGNSIKPATLDTGINILDNSANWLGKQAATISNNITGAVTNNPDIIDKLKLNRPDITNLSSQGFLNQGAMDQSASTFKVIAYDVPTKVALDAFDKLGKDMDKWIAEHLKLQMGSIKGTDIICTSMCLVMSILPCKTTNSIADAIQYIRELQSNIKSGLSQATQAEKDVLSQINTSFSGGATGLADIGTIKGAVTAAFSPQQTANQNNQAQQVITTVKNTVGSLATITQVLNLLVSVVKIGYADPWKVTGWLTVGAFDLLEHVLLALRAMAVQIADSILNKVISPIEKYLNNNTFPALCGVSAQVLFRKLLQMIYDFKKKILKFIADLFEFQKSARAKFDLFNKNMSLSLELSAFIKVLSLLMDNFLDIAIACGVQKRPCPDPDTSGSPGLSQNYDGSAVNDPTLVSFTPVLTDEPQPQSLNDISTKMQPLIDSIFPGSENTLSPGLVSSVLTNVPPLLASMLSNIPLGPNFSILPTGSNVKIIYQRPSFCS